eukprot:COSAG02_NODE_3587_length_6520_cov_6.037060_3_plen_82_part_00
MMPPTAPHLLSTAYFSVQQDGRHLHGIHSQQIVESQNAASLEFRSGNSPESMAYGMAKLHSKQHANNVAACRASANANAGA